MALVPQDGLRRSRERAKHRSVNVGKDFVNLWLPMHSLRETDDHLSETAEFLDWYLSDPLRVTTQIAEGGADFVLPIPYEQRELPESIASRLAQLLEVLTDATESGNFGYRAWSFWPSKTHIYLHDEIQKVITNELSPADYCQGMAT